MFGVKLSGPARVFCDNEAVVKSSTIPESRLKKKHCSIAYHRCREAVAAGKSLIYYEKSETNLADILTKSLSGSKRDPLAESLLSGWLSNAITYFIWWSHWGEFINHVHIGSIMLGSGKKLFADQWYLYYSDSIVLRDSDNIIVRVWNIKCFSYL